MSAEYWTEALEMAFDDEGLFDALATITTPEQRQSLGEGLQVSHEHYGMAHYSPPASDRLNAIEREWKAKYEALKREFEAYQAGAEKAVGRALGLRHDTNIGINSRGEVHRYDGSTEQIL